MNYAFLLPRIRGNKNDSVSNPFVMTPEKIVIDLHVIGITTKQARSVAIYAHKDIASEFTS